MNAATVGNGLSHAQQNPLQQYQAQLQASQLALGQLPHFSNTGMPAPPRPLEGPGTQTREELAMVPSLYLQHKATKAVGRQLTICYGTFVLQRMQHCTKRKGRAHSLDRPMQVRALGSVQYCNTP